MQTILRDLIIETISKTQGIYQTLTISEIIELKQTSSWDIGENLSSLRRKAVVWIKGNFPDPMRNYMTGLLLGHLDTDFEEMNELYSSLGIIHLLLCLECKSDFLWKLSKSYFCVWV